MPSHKSQHRSTWNLPAPPGFHGLRDDKEVTIYLRHLPHWRQDGATYFVTFRLHDSLPQGKLRELAAWRAEWERGHPPPHGDKTRDEFSREVMLRVEAWLDQGMGSCVLKHPDISAAVAQTMHRFDARRYELGAYVIMPNHVHALLRPLDGEKDPLERILQSWKRFSARRINERLRRAGSLWQEESFDRIVRDEEHLYRCIQYIGTNAARAGLSAQACPRWIRPEWTALGWGFAEP